MHTGLIKIAAIHNLSLAAAFGGPLFARALHGAVHKDVAATERVKLMEDAWTRYNKRVNVPAHLLFTATWLVERKAIQRYFMDRHTAKLVGVKDLFVAGALVTGLANVVAGEMMKRQIPAGTNVDKLDPAKAATLARYIGFFKVMGPLNTVLLGASIAIGPRIAASIIRHSKQGLLGRLFRK